MRRILSTFLVLFSVSTQAGLPPTTLSGQGQPNKPTTFTTQVPYRQATQISGVQSLIETGNENMLINPGFEGVANTVPNGWTCTSGACTKVSTAGNFSSGLSSMQVALTAQAMNVFQSVATLSGIQKQGYARVIYKVPSTMADFQVCTLVDGTATINEQTCVPSASLILDNTFRSIEIPLTLGTTSAGIRFKTTTAYTATAFFDGAILSQGLGTQNLMLDNLYSAQGDLTGIVSGENKDFINGNCTNANPSVCTFNTGIFTVAPVCTATPNNASARFLTTISSSTVVSIYQKDDTGVAARSEFSVHCQKSGNDYLASSANVYSAASANYDWTSYTPTLTNIGSASLTNVCKQARDGGDLLVDCVFTTNSSSAGVGSISLPSGLTLDANKLAINNLVSASGQGVGRWDQQGFANAGGPIITAPSTSTSVVYFSYGAGTSSLIPANASTFINSATTTVRFRVPISGWSNSNYIVGSFQGYNSTPNVNAPKIFSFRVTTTSGTVANNASGIVTSCTAANPTVCTLSGLTTAPICTTTVTGASSAGINAVQNALVSSTSLNIYTFVTSTGAASANQPVEVICQGQ